MQNIFLNIYIFFCKLFESQDEMYKFEEQEIKKIRPVKNIGMIS